MSDGGQGPRSEARGSPMLYIPARPDGLAEPGGHYSHAVVAGGLVHVAGQLPITAAGEHLVGAPFAAQVRQVLDNLDAALHGAGSDRSRLVLVRVYITEIGHWPAFNTIYGAWLGSHWPARVVVPVPILHHGFAIEAEATATT
jgi:2-iminobutanoate/2-iminopropanoate deaminase